jgi:hypothetical protein
MPLPSSVFPVPRSAFRGRPSAIVFAGALAAVVLAWVALAGEGDPRKPGGAGRFHDQPNPALHGGLTAVVAPIENLEEVIVVEPTEYRVYLATIDRAKGGFTIQGLPPGKYDLVLKFRSTVVEGLSLDVPDEFEKLGEKDWMYVQWEIWRSDDYFNDKTIARCGGNRARVKMLVDQVRDRPTFEPDGTPLTGIQIRRLELTELRKTGQVWQTKKSRHLYREERKMDAPGRKLTFVYAPKLGGIRVADEMVELPAIDARQIGEPVPPHFVSAHHREKGGHHDEKMPLP